jgi:hypothetical protein
MNYQSDKIQAANIQVDVNPWPFTNSAIHCPPRDATRISAFFQSVGYKVLIGADWSPKYKE